MELRHSGFKTVLGDFFARCGEGNNALRISHSVRCTTRVKIQRKSHFRKNYVGTFRIRTLYLIRDNALILLKCQSEKNSVGPRRRVPQKSLLKGLESIMVSPDRAWDRARGRLGVQFWKGNFEVLPGFPLFTIQVEENRANLICGSNLRLPE